MFCTKCQNPRKNKNPTWCSSCMSEYNKKRYELKRAQIRTKVYEYRKENIEVIRERARKNYAENSEEIRAYTLRFQRENKEKYYISRRAWGERNRPKLREYGRRRDAIKLGATPQWLTAIQKAQIQEFYEISEARTIQTGVQHHVDHIHPLKGRTVCGLHVPWNLQVLTSTENISKGNRLGAC